jgi:hypothetical protein
MTNQRIKSLQKRVQRATETTEAKEYVFKLNEEQLADIVSKYGETGTERDNLYSKTEDRVIFVKQFSKEAETDIDKWNEYVRNNPIKFVRKAIIKQQKEGGVIK